MTQPDKLLCCPFCAEEDIAEIQAETGLKLGCTNCSAEADYFDWNKRYKQSIED